MLQLSLSSYHSMFFFINYLKVSQQYLHILIFVMFILGHVASLQCRASSDPNVPYEIRWYHEGQLINAASSFRINTDDASGTLEIGEARASDAGEYTCEVASAGGNDRRSASLDVIELPYAPTHVHAEKVATAHKTVNVSWTPGFNGNSPVIKYILQYR